MPARWKHCSHRKSDACSGPSMSPRCSASATSSFAACSTGDKEGDTLAVASGYRREPMVTRRTSTVPAASTADCQRVPKLRPPSSVPGSPPRRTQAERPACPQRRTLPHRCRNAGSHRRRTGLHPSPDPRGNQGSGPLTTPPSLTASRALTPARTSLLSGRGSRCSRRSARSGGTGGRRRGCTPRARPAARGSPGRP